MGRVTDQHLDQLADVTRPTDTNTSEGPVTTYPVVQADVPCSVAPGGRMPIETAAAGGTIAASTWVLSLPRGTDVRAQDRIVVGSRTFQVVGPRSPRTYELQADVVCTEVL
jgi:head-tail adaptor